MNSRDIHSKLQTMALALSPVGPTNLISAPDDKLPHTELNIQQPESQVNTPRPSPLSLDELQNIMNDVKDGPTSPNSLLTPDSARSNIAAENAKLQLEIENQKLINKKLEEELSSISADQVALFIKYKILDTSKIALKTMIAAAEKELSIESSLIAKVTADKTNEQTHVISLSTAYNTLFSTHHAESKSKSDACAELDKNVSHYKSNLIPQKQHELGQLQARLLSVKSTPTDHPMGKTFKQIYEQRPGSIEEMRRWHTNGVISAMQRRGKF